MSVTAGLTLNKQLIPAAAYRRVDTAPTTPVPTPGGGTGTGLRADYFNNANLAAPLVVSRVDATVDFNWSDGAPAPALNADYFSVRWTGQVEAPVTGNYTLQHQHRRWGSAVGEWGAAGR